MLNNSIAQLPAKRNDLTSIARKLQLAITALDKVTGNTATLPVAKLSRLEGEVPIAIETLPQIAEAVERINFQIVEAEQTATALASEVSDLAARITDLEEAAQFDGLANNDLNDAAWAGAEGLNYGVVLGSDLSNYPTAITINLAADYSLFMSTRTAGAYLQTLYITGNSERRNFIRGGADFAAAVTSDWTEL